MKFAFIARNVSRFPTAWMCRRLGVSPSGFYAWRSRGLSNRAVVNDRLRMRIRAHHAASGGTYGSPRIQRDLRAEGMRVSKRRVARLMREEGLQGRRKRRFRTTTIADSTQPAAPNLLKRQFSVNAPNIAWVCDITYVRTWEGWLYLAVVIDLYARRVVGYAMSDHMRTELVLEALDAAVALRRPEAGLIINSDRGSQYTSDAHLRALRRMGARASTSARRHLFRQRGRRKLFRDAQGGADLSTSMADDQRGEVGHRGVHRWVLQHAAPAFNARICQPDRFRGNNTPAAIRCLTKLSTFSRQHRSSRTPARRPRNQVTVVRKRYP